LYHAAGGVLERDAGAVWRAAVRAIREAVGGHAEAVAAVGVTGCGNGAVFLDSAGRPLCPGILSGDTRATAFVRRGEYPGQTAVLLRWLRAQRPSLARKLDRVAFWKDFVRLQLAGELVTEPTDFSAAGEFSTSEPALPPRVPSLSTAGHVTSAAARATGLRAGTPVVAGCLDCEASALGSGLHKPGEVSVVAGTWAIAQAYVHRRPRSRRHFLVNPSVEPGRWLVLEGSPGSAANFDWAVGALAAGLAPSRAAGLAAKAAAGNLVFVPRVPAGHGAFLGLDPRHDRADLLRAVMEGIVFAHRAQLERLAATTGAPRRVLLSGGIARSAFWRRLFADGLGREVVVPRVQESGALGVALIAGVCAGLWPSLASAQAATVQFERTITPDPENRNHLDIKYRRYRRLADRLS
jgi:L-xylulokinase